MPPKVKMTQEEVVAEVLAKATAEGKRYIPYEQSPLNKRRVKNKHANADFTRQGY